MPPARMVCSSCMLAVCCCYFLVPSCSLRCFVVLLRRPTGALQLWQVTEWSYIKGELMLYDASHSELYVSAPDGALHVWSVLPENAPSTSNFALLTAEGWKTHKPLRRFHLGGGTQDSVCDTRSKQTETISFLEQWTNLLVACVYRRGAPNRR